MASSYRHRQAIAVARILIFEDNAEFADLLRQSLEALEHDVSITALGDEAFALLSGSGFDLAIVDIFIRREGQVVPDGGLLLLGRLKNLRSTRAGRERRRLPVIAISGEFNNRGIGEIGNFARSFGADEILAKPFTHSELLAVIDRLLSDREAPDPAG